MASTSGFLDVFAGASATDLSSNEELTYILECATELLEIPENEFNSIKAQVFGNCTEFSTVLTRAIKAAESRKLILQCPACHLTCLWAMYNEHNRAKPSSAENPNGQDFVRNKYRTMVWLTEGTKVQFNLVGVDDGCPNNSGEIVQNIINEENYSNAKVLYLQQAIDEQIEMFKEIKTTRDSRKGGAILYGLYHTIHSSAEVTNLPHYVMYTDADLSACLTQVGYILQPLIVENKHIGLGERYGYDESFLIKDNIVGHPTSHFEQPNCLHIVMRHWLRKYLIPPLGEVYDTNTPFKCYPVLELNEFLSNVQTFGPAFDIDVLTFGYIHHSQAGVPESDILSLKPILFTEDFVESNFTANDSDPDQSFKSFFTMISEIRNMSKKFGFELNEKGLEVLEFSKLITEYKMYKTMMLKFKEEHGWVQNFDSEFEIPMLTSYMQNDVETEAITN